MSNTEIELNNTCEDINTDYKVVFLIPYFGRIPDYFELWAQSASNNPSFMFYIFSDLPFDVEQYSNIKLFPMSFSQLRSRIQELMDFKIVLHSPYKLCDYKPAYGHIFSEFIKDFDFWGFCDVDLIFGRISDFITPDILSEYDKILFQGHFSLMRNNDKMNMLYRRKLNNVQDYRFAFSTKLDCHFDENGTIAYADEYDESIRFGFGWIFFDTNVYLYELFIRETEACVVWQNGVLTAYWDNGKRSEEYMYIHLQKRKMIRQFSGLKNGYAIMRNEFLELKPEGIFSIMSRPVNYQLKHEFEHNQLKTRRRIIFRKIVSGWISSYIGTIRFKWRKEKRPGVSIYGKNERNKINKQTTENVDQ